MNRYSEQELIPIRKIEDFWIWFQDQSDYFKDLLHQNADVETLIFEPLGAALNEIQTEIFFLLGYKDTGEAELILTADGNIKNMFLIDALISHAPELPHWKFIGHKKAMDLDNLHIGIGNMEFDKDTIFFRPVIHEHYPDIIDLEIYYAQFQKEEINSIHQGIFIFLDNYIGELNFVKLIDQIVLLEDIDDNENLIPIGKLKDYLLWREKEFVEKYTEPIIEEEFSYSLMSATLPSNNTLIAIINTSILQWDAKASYPWVGILTINYPITTEDGFPDDATQTLLETIENKLNDNLTVPDGAIHIGRQTVNGIRELFFVANNYNTLAQVFYACTNEFREHNIQSEVYKDKYWRTFDKYQSVTEEEE